MVSGIRSDYTVITLFAVVNCQAQHLLVPSGDLCLSMFLPWVSLVTVNPEVKSEGDHIQTTGHSPSLCTIR